MPCADREPQAANMWKMLDDLAVTDSAAYAEMAKAGADALVRTPPYWTMDNGINSGDCSFCCSTKL